MTRTETAAALALVHTAFVVLKDGSESAATFTAQADGTVSVQLFGTDAFYVVAADREVEVVETLEACACGQAATSGGECFGCRYQPFGSEWRREQHDRGLYA